MFAYINWFYFQKKSHGFIEADNPLEKVVIVKEELNHIHTGDIENLDFCSLM